GQLLFFETKRQHSWLIATERFLILVLDDAETRKGRRLVQRVMPLSEVEPITATIRKDGLGSVGFGRVDLRSWYYSPTLFASPRALEEAVASLVARSRVSAMREQARNALARVGVISAEDIALDIIVEAAKFFPAPGFNEQISLSRLFCGTI